MKNNIIGREAEIASFEKYAQSGKAEFVAIYGRRRVGKTFLVNHILQDSLCFSMTGIIEGNKEAQLHAFIDAMDIFGEPVSSKPKNWYEAFQMLHHFLQKRIRPGKRCYVFIDELPCFDTHLSDFVNALGYFWNSWAEKQDEMFLVVCGSATSWMMENVIDSHGGLHDRITHEIHLKEFTLKETETYLQSEGFPWDRMMVLQAYMIMGGIPYYLSLLNQEYSLAQNIDSLFFQEDGEMKREFHRLYKTLFARPDGYISIIEALFRKKKGMTRDEIAKTIGKDPNGRLSKMLQNLIDCDIIRFYHTKQRKVTSRNGVFQLLDFYSLFYLQFVKGNLTDEHFWTKSMHTPAINTWLGLSFERVCLTHIKQIKHALGIDGINSVNYSWRSADDVTRQDSQQVKVQIDIVIERADRMVNICEVKYSEQPYSIDKEEFEKVQKRIAAFREQTAFAGGIIPTFITTMGLQRNAYSENFTARITLNDLFY